MIDEQTLRSQLDESISRYEQVAAAPDPIVVNPDGAPIESVYTTFESLVLQAVRSIDEQSTAAPALSDVEGPPADAPTGGKEAVAGRPEDLSETRRVGGAVDSVKEGQNDP